MPRVRLPPAALWPAPPGADPGEVLLWVVGPKNELGQQPMWIRWHSGDRRGWCLEWHGAVSLTYIRNYWLLTGLHVTVRELTRVNS